jgi:hypothetical protein
MVLDLELASRRSLPLSSRGSNRVVLASGHGVPMSGDEIARELRTFADHFSGSSAKKHPKA